MSKLLNCIYGRVYGWFDSKGVQPFSKPAPTRFSRRARLLLTNLEDRTTPAVFMVTNTGDNGGVNPTVGAGTGTLRQAIVDSVAASTADEITFSAGVFSTPQTITLSAALPGIGATTLANSLTISGPGQNLLTISGQSKFRVFDTSAGATKQPILVKDLTISGASFSGNGGAVNIGDEAVTLQDITITNSTVTGDGGAINVAGSAGTGPGISTLTLIRGTITNNFSGDDGAGIASQSTAAHLNISETTISGNTGTGTSSNGAAIYFNSGGSLLLDRSTLSGNVAKGATAGGGAIYIFGTAAAGGFNITNTTISGNSSASNGGGVVLRTFTGTVNFTNSTITNNTAATTSGTAGTGGGGISQTSGTGTFNLSNTIVSGNFSGNGNDDLAAVSLVGSSYSAVGSPNGFTFSSSNGNLFDGSIAGLKLGALSLNGGPTRTHVPGSGSTAINTGDPSLTTGVDQRGLPRLFGSAADIGSVERQATEPPGFITGALQNVTADNAGTNPYMFTITYVDDVSINKSTLDSSDIRVTFPNATSVLATFVSASPNVDAPSVDATYSFVPPGGTWDGADNGTYKLSIEPNQVKNTSGVAILADTVGTFRVLIPATFTVTNTGDNGGVNPVAGAGSGTLRQAIVDANATAGTADTIVFDNTLFSSPQKISLLAALPVITDRVIITGPGSSLLTVARGVTTSFTLLSLADTSGSVDMKISGLKLDGVAGTATSTGIITSDEIVTLNDVHITGISTTSAGGAIRVGASSKGTLTLTNSVITGNTTTSTGAGITAYAGTTLIIDRTTISNNVASGAGGGINFTNSTVGQSLMLTNSTISGNTSKTTTTNYGGGGISFPGSPSAAGFLIRGSTISGNSAAGSGGGVVFRSLNGALNGVVHIQNSTITNNTAGSTSTTMGLGGGGVAISTIGATQPMLDIESTIITGNIATVTNGYDDLSVNATANLEITFSAIGDDNGYFINGASNDNLTNFESSVAQLGLGALGFNNGGITKTHNLAAGSTALEKGSNPSNVTPELVTDQNGVARVQPVSIGIIDIGSVERVSGIPSATVGVLPAVTSDQAGTNNPYTFTITYSDDTAINRSTIGNLPADDIALVKIGGGFSVNATFVSADSAVNAPTIVATYKFSPPGGTWDSTDNGSYEVRTLLNGVKNTSNTSVPVVALNSITVNVPAPAATATAATVSADNATTNPYKFTVTYTDPSAIDVSSIVGNNNAVRVVGPGAVFDVPASYVSIDTGTNGSPRTATYSITPPGGTWDGSDNGNYSIVIQANQVKNVNPGTFIATGTVGSFFVGLPNLFVTNTNDAGAGSLRQAVIDANTNPGKDIIAFDPSFNTGTATITLTSGVLAISEAVTIIGPLGAVTVSGNNASRVFDVSSSPAAAGISISNLTLANGSAATGAGIFTGDEFVTLTNVTVRDSKTTGRGAGIFVGSTANLTLANSVISGNSAGSDGGGIYVASGATATVSVTDSTIANNTSALDGGGIYFFSGGNLSLTRSTISGNKSSGTTGGGGIYFFGTVGAGGFNIINSTVSGNSAANSGGGIVLTSFTGQAFIRNSTITGNISASTSTAAGFGGGGISQRSGAGTLILESTIVSGNTANPTNSADDLAALNPPLITFSAISDFDGYSPDGSSTDNIFGSLINLGTLASNGGPTQTHELLAGSPAINAGSNSLGLTTDQRGTGFTRVDDGAPDIGAFERKQGVPTATGGPFTNVSVNDPTTNPYFFDITYQNNVNILFSSLDNNDIRVTYPNGTTSVLATFVSASPPADSPSIVATYKITPPGGTWDAADNGIYTISVEGSQVNSANGKSVAAATIGTFNVGFPNTYTVTTAADVVDPNDGVISLREAILAANAAIGTPDIILFSSLFNTPQTITLGGTELPITDSLAITGPVSKVTISGGDASRIFNISGPGTLDVSFANVNLTAGKTTTTRGGAVSIDNEQVSFTDSSISNSTATASNGGGIGIASSGATLTLLRTSVSNNSASANGGGIDAGPGGVTVSITDSTLSGNTTNANGGALGQGAGMTTMSRSTVSGNRANAGGGGFYFSNSIFDFDNSTISSNTATTNGGAILLTSANATPPTIRNSTITANSAGTNGGGIARTSGTGTLTFESTIIAGNLNAATPDFNFNTQTTLNADTTLIGVNDVGNFDLNGFGNNNFGTLGFPTDPILGPLASNGGPTKTHEVLAGSPAVDNGSNSQGYTTDQRGTGFNRVVGALPDVGAFERVGGTPNAFGGPFTPINSSTVAFSDPYVFTVTYANESDILFSTLDNSDIRIIGPGFNKLATFVSASPASDAPSIMATYQVSAPVGGWTGANNGSYIVSVEANQVKSSNSKFVPAGSIGAFVVVLPPFLVTNANDSGAGSLREAIANANANAGPDIIAFDAGFFDGTVGKNVITLSSALPAINEDITINGPGMSKLTVSGNNTSRVFDVSLAPLGALISISDLTIANGSAATGAGLLTGDEVVTLTNVTVKDSKTSGRGAGIFVGSATAGNLTLVSSVVSGNSAGSDGGGIYVAGSTAGGTPVVSITDTTIANNTSGADGGGIYFFGGGSFSLNRSTISGNKSSGATGGGGIYFFGIVSGNGFSILNSTISGNSAANSGGGIVLTSFTGEAVIRNSTITGNTSASTSTAAGFGGGGISQRSGVGTVTLESTIVSGNTASVTNGRDDLAALNAPLITFSAIFDSDGFTEAGGSGSNLPAATNLNLGALANNGGPTQTHLPGAGSPLIDAGFNFDPVNNNVDQRGLNRDFGTTDIGSVELQTVAPVVTGFTVNGGAIQRSRLTTIRVTFAGSVDASAFQASGAITLLRTAATAAGTVGTIVNTSNGLIVSAVGGDPNSLDLTFANIANSGVEFGSLADGRWQLAIASASFTSTAGDEQLRRLYGDINNDGTVSGNPDFAQFGSAFGTTPGIGVSAFDFNNDGQIDGSTDFAQFGARFGLTL